MAEKRASLNERQKMILKHLLSKFVDSPTSTVEVLKDPKKQLAKLGATEADVEAIRQFADQLQEQLKVEGRVGWW